MNYIYDILLNFKKEFYEFYDWNNFDEISHVKKIPTFKISSKNLYIIKNNKIKINEDFLTKINNAAEEFKKSEVSKIKYACIFSDGNDIIAVIFNKNGISSYKSSILIDEQDDLIEIIKYQREIYINYKIIKKERIEQFKTRFERENELFLFNELDKVYNENNINKINYIYLECFGKTEYNIDSAIKKLKKEITKGNDNFYKIFDILKIANQK